MPVHPSCPPPRALTLPLQPGGGGELGPQTSEYDRVATSHMALLLTPPVVGLWVHSLVFQGGPPQTPSPRPSRAHPPRAPPAEHVGWYNWALSSAVAGVYAFGFASMTPQLYVNMKLRSVAHLPWRVLMYRSFNTFIDDLFAFVIRMPTMHRIRWGARARRGAHPARPDGRLPHPCPRAQHPPRRRGLPRLPLSAVVRAPRPARPCVSPVPRSHTGPPAAACRRRIYPKDETRTDGPEGVQVAPVAAAGGGKKE